MLLKYILLSFAFLFSHLAIAQDAPSCTSTSCTPPDPSYFCYSNQYCFKVAEGDSPVRSSGPLPGCTGYCTKWSGISEPFHSPTFTLNSSTGKWVPDSGSLDFIWLNPAYLTIEGYSSPFPPTAYSTSPLEPDSSAPDLTPLVSSFSGESIIAALLAIAVIFIGLYLLFYARGQVTKAVDSSAPVSGWFRKKKG